MFIDDLDRCRALTTAFVSERRRTTHPRPGEPGSSLRAWFIIGLDPVVVASHLDRVYSDVYDPDTDLDEEDPSRGWAFLRKLVHLPVLVPQIPDEEMFRIVDLILGARRPRPDGSVDVVRAEAGLWQPRTDPRLHALIHQRLAAHPDRSIREATRHINLWDFYERVVAATEPDPGEAGRFARSQHLVILAEIVTRWPAMQRFLHRRSGSRTGLQLLAAAATLDSEWQHAAYTVLSGHDARDEVLAALRELLRDHDGAAVADQAARLW